MNQRLAEACCTKCEKYSPDCARCIGSYYIKLIEKDYTPNYLVEDLKRKLYHAKTTTASCKKQLEYLLESLDDGL